jgi:hypothetical protein
MKHVVAVDVDWADDYSRMLVWDTIWCDCDVPWRHGRECLGFDETDAE